MSAYDQLREELARSPRRWLVTGGAGFIGSHICECLLELGQDVVALDNLSTGRPENVEELETLASSSKGVFRFTKGDIRDRDTCFAAADAIDHVLHQAAVASVPRSMATPELHHAHNVDGFFHMLEASRAAKVRSFVYASSSSVFGDSPAMPKREADTGALLSPYAATKAINEVYAATWSRAYGLPTTGLRYFNVFGPRQDPSGPYAAVVPRWVEAFCAGERPRIFGDGQTSRDFCPVANAVQANLLAACAIGDAEARVLNVSLGGRTTLDELCSKLREALVEMGVPCGAIEPVYEDFRPGDIRHSQADISAARELLGYSPDVGFEQGIRQTVGWFVQRADVQPADLASSATEQL